MVKIPTDRKILKVIHGLYYKEFCSFDKDKHSRKTKIFVPIDCSAIARKLKVDDDIIFGRLYYHLDKKFRYKQDDGSNVHLFAVEVGGDKNAINFPLLSAVVADLQQSYFRYNLPLIISIVALAASFLVPYLAYLRPAKVIGSISHVVTWRFSSLNNGKITDKKLTPSFWLGNIGARPIIIEDIRLHLKDSNGIECNAYPVNSVPLEAINYSTEFNDYGKLSLGGPFQGFSLAPSEKWQSTYNYSVKDDCFKKIRGLTNVYVEIKSKGKNIWEEVLNDKLLVGNNGFSPGRMLGPVESRHIYTEKWKQRKE
ncbi:hypothetical protein DSCA_00290 [Desulfosarcina alkanivorans]|uniref:Uncharacterized protein n=1 Tax=Desulfosarcina alkanivorans TaxID=571177 RepID=A0A5K7YEE9_9BACT|nr:hypothetical protein [Desulfosarcina alkanivorans]BBO66099.1 hypothetical protein DSCA_00290 [Desulfosarcina alkanivorans]